MPEVSVVCMDVMGMPYEVYMARLCGADALIIVADVLSREDIEYFIKVGKSAGVLGIVEVHSREQLEVAMGIEGTEAVLVAARDYDTLEFVKVESLDGVVGGMVPREDVLVFMTDKDDQAEMDEAWKPHAVFRHA